MRFRPFLIRGACVGNGKDRRARDRVVEGRADERAAICDHERQRIDACALVDDARHDRRSPCGDAFREHPDLRWSHVVDPRTEDVGTGQRAVGELVGAGIDRDVEALHLRERGAGCADVDAEIEGQLVDAHRRPGVALDVALVRRAQEPRVDEPGSGLDGHADVRDRLVDARDVERLRSGFVHRRPDVVGRRSEGGSRAAVRRNPVWAVDRLSYLQLHEPLRLQELELRAAHEELVRDLARRRAVVQQDEPVVLAGLRTRASARDGDQVGLAAGRHQDGRRKVE